MHLVLFWIGWALIGRYVVFPIWFGLACSPGACSGMLLPLEPSLYLTAGAWIAAGLTGAAWLGRSRARQDPAGPTAFELRVAALENEDRHLQPGELMAKYAISSDGKRYTYAGYQYDALEDALQYARMAAAGTGASR